MSAVGPREGAGEGDAGQPRPDRKGTHRPRANCLAVSSDLIKEAVVKAGGSPDVIRSMD